MKFDAAISIGLIFLLSESDQFKMLAKVSKILKPGARFLFTAPIETGSWKDVITSQTSISLGKDAYKNALLLSGFKNIQLFKDSGKNNYYEAQKNND